MRDSRYFLVLCLHLLLFAVVYTVNSGLGPWGVQLRLDALWVLFPAAFFRLGPGAIVVGLGGLVAGATQPLPFGAAFVLSLAGFVMMLLARPYFRRDQPALYAAAALVTNAVMVGGLAFWVGATTAGGLAPVGWWRTVQDLVVSQVILALIAAPWVELCDGTLRRAGIELGAELQRW